MKHNVRWTDEMDKLRYSFFAEGFHCLVYNVNEAYNLVKTHEHDFPQVIIIVQGAVRQTQNNKVYNLHAGDILFTPPGMEHSMSLAQQKFFYNFSVTNEIARAALTAAYGERCNYEDIELQFTPHQKDMNIILSQIAALECTLDNIEICNGEDAFYKEVVYHQAFALLHMLFSAAGKGKSVLMSTKEDERESSIESLINYLDNHYYEEICFAEVAKRFEMSQSTMSRRFYAARGIKLQDYLNQRRVEEAQKLMAKPDISLSYVADAVGYQDFSTFFRNFKRCCGLSPSQYREKLFAGQTDAYIQNIKTKEDDLK